MSLDTDPTDLFEVAQSDAERHRRTQIAEEQERADVVWLMGTKQGRRAVWRLLCNAKMFAPTFNATAMLMAYSEGRRAYGIELFARLHAWCPDLYSTMEKENGRRDGDANGPNIN